jgi:ferredoxin-NADP reductase
MSYQVKLLNKKRLNHDVIQFHFERPPAYEFVAGQAIELTLDGSDKKGPAPFTFTGLNSEPNLELTIKIYEAHNGLTAALAKLNPADEVTITAPWDSFTNKGPGIFIAGGAGITPFVAMLRQMHADKTIGNSRLFFSNKESDDVFLHDELKAILGDRYIDVLTRDKNSKYQRIDETFLLAHTDRIDQPYYVCGPPGFMEAIEESLAKIGASKNYINISL